MSFSSPLFKPPWTLAGRLIESAIRKALYDFNLVKDTKKVAVALSGGKDSMTLLMMLAAISGRGTPPFELLAIHVDGEFSCGAGVNKEYLQKLCQELNVPFITRKSNKTLEELECYSCSRERRTLIFNTAKEEGCNTIAFGHHRDDNAQTVLMNLLHKGEFAGILPKITMREYGVTIIRPLIYIEEEKITAFAKAQGFMRITCRCPVGQKSMRKKTSLLLKEIEDLYPNAVNNLSSASLLYGTDKANRK